VCFCLFLWRIAAIVAATQVNFQPIGLSLRPAEPDDKDFFLYVGQPPQIQKAGAEGHGDGGLCA